MRTTTYDSRTRAPGTDLPSRRRFARGPISLGRRRGAGDGGFTLIEIMIVVSILLSLVAILTVKGASYILSSKKRGTQALIERLKLHVDEYQSITGKLPPDGIDFSVENEQGVRLRSGAALYHALTAPIEQRQMVAGVPKMVRHEGITAFKEGELTAPNPEFPGVREILDGYDIPIHYDNTLDGFSPHGGEVHYPPEEQVHAPDPRTLPKEQGGVPRPNQAQSQKYDLWSHGATDETGGREPVIATWNLKESG